MPDTPIQDLLGDRQEFRVGLVVKALGALPPDHARWPGADDRGARGALIAAAIGHALRGVPLDGCLQTARGDVMLAYATALDNDPEYRAELAGLLRTRPVLQALDAFLAEDPPAKYKIVPPIGTDFGNTPALAILITQQILGTVAAALAMRLGAPARFSFDELVAAARAVTQIELLKTGGVAYSIDRYFDPPAAPVPTPAAAELVERALEAPYEIRPPAPESTDAAPKPWLPDQ